MVITQVEDEAGAGAERDAGKEAERNTGDRGGVAGVERDTEIEILIGTGIEEEEGVEVEVEAFLLANNDALKRTLVIEGK